MEDKKTLLDKINIFNDLINDAKQSYLNKEKIDEALEFPTEVDLQRYIDSCDYEKAEVIKELLNNCDIDTENFSTEDKKIIEKVSHLMKLLPKEMHKCIGCPCLENDYPQCENCSFQDSCLSGNSPYPDECDENDCFNTFEYLHNNL